MAEKKNGAVQRAAQKRRQFQELEPGIEVAPPEIRGEDEPTEIEEPLDLRPQPDMRNRYIGPRLPERAKPDPAHIMRTAELEDEDDEDGLEIQLGRHRVVVFSKRPTGMGPAAKRRQFNQEA